MFKTKNLHIKIKINIRKYYIWVEFLKKNLKLLFELIKSFENLRLSIYGKDEINLSLSLDNNLKKN